MPASRLTRTLARVAAHAPLLRRMPVLRLLAVAEVAMLTRDHVGRLTPAERRRGMELLRQGRMRPRNLNDSERAELIDLVVKLDPRGLAGEAADAVSPVSLPNRLKYGSPRRRASRANS